VVLKDQMEGLCSSVCFRRYRCAQPPATSYDAFGIGVLAIHFRRYGCAQPPATSCDAFGIGVLAIHFRRYGCAQPPVTSYDAFGIGGHSFSFPEVWLRHPEGMQTFSRWLSVAIPPENKHLPKPHPERVPAQSRNRSL